MLIRWIVALGYKVVILPRGIEWEDIPQIYWGVAVSTDDSHQLLFIVPIPCHCELTRYGVFLGSR